MDVLRVDDCIAEAIRLLAAASSAANNDERIRLLDRAAARLQEAKLRALEQSVPATEGPKDA
jgi:hypothetical protein